MAEVSRGTVRPYVYRRKGMEPKCVWRAYAKVCVTGRDGRKVWKTRSKVFAGIECSARPDGTYSGERAAKRALEGWREQVLEQLGKDERAAEQAGTVTDMEIPDFVDWYIETLSTAGGRDGVIEQTTKDGYTMGAARIKRWFGGVKVSELTPEMVAEFKAWLSTAPKQHGGTISLSTQSKTYGFLSSAYRYLYRMRLIEENPFDFVYPVKRPEPSPNPLTRRNLDRLTSQVLVGTCSDLETAIALGLRLGLRRGEVCGLRFSDCDFESRVIRIQNTVTLSYSRTVEKQPKGRRNQDTSRAIPMSERVCEVLLGRLAALQRECRELGVPADRLSYVCGTVDGRPMDPGTLTKRWTGLAQAMGLTGTRGRVCVFHDLRHTFATFALASGVDPVTVGGIMGHRDVSVTLKVYADSLSKVKTQAMSVMDGVFAPAPPAVPAGAVAAYGGVHASESALPLYAQAGSYVPAGAYVVPDLDGLYKAPSSVWEPE